MLEAVQLPAGVTGLDTGLAKVDGDDLTHCIWLFVWVVVGAFVLVRFRWPCALAFAGQKAKPKLAGRLETREIR